MCKENLKNQLSEMSDKMISVVESYLTENQKFTGKIVFTVNCNTGGIGNVEAYVQKKI